MQLKSLTFALTAICAALPALSGFDAQAEADKPDIVIDGVPLSGATAPWTGGARNFLKTGPIEGGKPVRLEAIVFRPAGEGPFPLAIVNHGSTGRGNDPACRRRKSTAISAN